MIDQAYDSLKDSVYGSLVMQTRLKPYLDQIELVIDDNGLRLDASRLNQMLADKFATDPENALADLLDLDRYAGAFLSGTNWEGLANFDQMIETLPQIPAIAALLAEFKVRTLSDANDTGQLGANDNIVLGARVTMFSMASMALAGCSDKEATTACRAASKTICSPAGRATTCYTVIAGRIPMFLAAASGMT